MIGFKFHFGERLKLQLGLVLSLGGAWHELLHFGPFSFFNNRHVQFYIQIYTRYDVLTIYSYDNLGQETSSPSSSIIYTFLILPEACLASRTLVKVKGISKILLGSHAYSNRGKRHD